jgi:adenosyl cobinamide kinase/adenosyl cobinamide phosphate guanylyltransferase
VTTRQENDRNARGSQAAGWAEDLADELVFLAKLDGTLDQLDADMTKRVSRHESARNSSGALHTDWTQGNLSRRVGRFLLSVVVPLFLQ